MSQPSLLVSVRCADEVAAAVEGGAEIIDVKEPSYGSLGMALPETLAACSDAVPERLLWTFAAGELLDSSGKSDSAACRVAVSLPKLERLPYAVKFGLSQCCDIKWTEVFQDVAASLPVSVRAVPVAYADGQAAGSPTVPDVLEAAAQNGWATVLVDTFDKAGSGSLLDLFPVETIQGWVVQASRHGVEIILAGRLSVQDVPAVSACEPMAVAVRSAVCVGGRTGRVDTQLVQMVASCCQAGFVNSQQSRIGRNELKGENL